MEMKIKWATIALIVCVIVLWAFFGILINEAYNAYRKESFISECILKDIPVKKCEEKYKRMQSFMKEK